MKDRGERQIWSHSQYPELVLTRLTSEKNEVHEGKWTHIFFGLAHDRLAFGPSFLFVDIRSLFMVRVGQVSAMEFRRRKNTRDILRTIFPSSSSIRSHIAVSALYEAMKAT